MRFFKCLTVFSVFMAAWISAADAGSPPTQIVRTRADLAAACASLGARGQGQGLDLATGPYGCRNLETGGAVMCQTDGNCKDYGADPRWKKMHDLLAAPAQRQQSIAI